MTKADARFRAGKHPLGPPLHPDAPPVEDRGVFGRRCGNCVFRVFVGSGRDRAPKCGREDVPARKRRERDATAWWPGCVYHEWEVDEVVPGIRVDDVVVGDRRRNDPGDIDALVASIRSIGLIHPITVDRRGCLIAGWRRLEAYRRLGRESIPVVYAEDVNDVLQRLRAERDDDTCRQQMTASETLAFAARVEDLMRPVAEQRQRDGGGRRFPGGSVFSHKYDTREKVAAVTGWSTATYSRIKQVAATAAGRSNTAAPYITPQIQQQAQEAMKLIDRISVGEVIHDDDGHKMSVTGVYEKWRNNLDRGFSLHGDRERRRSAEMNTEMSATKTDTGVKRQSAATQPIVGARQKTAVASIVHQMTAAAYAIDNIVELDGSITKDEASRWAADLAKSSRTLRRLERFLKDHSHANH